MVVPNIPLEFIAVCVEDDDNATVERHPIIGFVKNPRVKDILDANGWSCYLPVFLEDGQISATDIDIADHIGMGYVKIGIFPVGSKSDSDCVGKARDHVSYYERHQERQAAKGGQQ